MADTLIVAPDWSTGATLYLELGLGANILDAAASPKAFVPFNSANWARYAIAVPEQPSGSRRYYLDFLAFAGANPAIIAGYYSWFLYRQAGGSPASSDIEIGRSSAHWSGSEFDSVASSGVSVDHNYQATGKLLSLDSNNQPISGIVRAYLLNEYFNDPKRAYIRGEALTRGDGTWTTDMNLSPGNYIFTFSSARNSRKPVSLEVG